MGRDELGLVAMGSAWGMGAECQALIFAVHRTPTPGFSPAFRSLPHDIVHRPPEVAEIGPQRRLLIGVEVAHLRSLDLLQRFRQVGIEGRDESGFYTDSPLLQFRRVEVEIVLAEGLTPTSFTSPRSQFNNPGSSSIQ